MVKATTQNITFKLSEMSVRFRSKFLMALEHLSDEMTILILQRNQTIFLSTFLPLPYIFHLLHPPLQLTLPPLFAPRINGLMEMISLKQILHFLVSSA